MLSYCSPFSKRKNCEMKCVTHDLMEDHSHSNAILLQDQMPLVLHLAIVSVLYVDIIQIHMFIADIKVHIQYTIKIFKLKCHNDFTLYLNTNHNQLTIIK